VSDTEEQPEHEIAPGCWRWSMLPLAGFGFAAQIADAWATLFSNLSFATGAHLKYVQQQKAEAEQVIFKD
jgi:hypothetical protein